MRSLNRNLGERERQLAYSEIQPKTHDEAKRVQKATKIEAVLRHFLGRTSLQNLVAVDLGCSTGFTAAQLAHAGADVIGLDIDVPGLAYANERFGQSIRFVRADGSAIPLGGHSIDIVVFNHIYEHVVDPDAIMREILRILKPDGVAYLGFGNRFGVIEPHYRLPFLSWLPRRAADRYIAATGRATSYYERYRSRSALIEMCRGLNLWDYTYTVLRNSEMFAATDMVPSRLKRAPAAFWRAFGPVMPTFVWVGTPGQLAPRGSATPAAPRPLRRRK